MQNQLILTLVIIALAFGIKIAISIWLKRNQESDGYEKRQLINTSKNLINLLLTIALFVIWQQELQKFALSIAAFIVAIVLATKEVIQCLVGFAYLSSTNPFRIGDWIQTGSFTGEVVATDWAKVSLLEVDTSSYGYTGRTVYIPNSQLLTQPVKNLNFMRRYVNHSFSVVRDEANVNPFKFQTTLMDKAIELCADFAGVAERYTAMIESRLDVRLAGPKPSINFCTTELGKTKAVFNVFCPIEQASEIEQALISLYLEQWNLAKTNNEVDEEAQ